MNQTRWAELEASIPGLVVESAGGSVPFQSEGTLHSMPYYFRYRGGGASLRLSPVGHDDTHMDTVLYSASLSYGDWLSGSLNPDEFSDLMRQCVVSLSIAPISWKFRGLRVNFKTDSRGNLAFEPTEETRFYQGWGYTAEQGYAALHDYLDSFDLTDEQLEELKAMECIERQPLNEDDRVFPTVPPVFSVTHVPVKRKF